MLNKEPDFAPHTSKNKSRLGVLLVNLGSPNATTPKSIRQFLRLFLSDRRVVEIPRPIWWLILNTFILPRRPNALQKKYEAIWDQQTGNPLLAISQQQAILLQKEFHNAPIKVLAAMCYSEPSIESVLNDPAHQDIGRWLVLPMYPQYSATTTAAASDMIFKQFFKMRWQPALTTISHYCDHPAYIHAGAQQISRFWQVNGKPNFTAGDRLVFSFHGLPERNRQLGDPYYCQCLKTARLLADALHLQHTDYQVTFQSRFGKAKWLEPYTDVVLKQLGAQAIRVDVFCPGFPTDCLETLEEIAIANKTLFLAHGGKSYHYIPALNVSPEWIIALKQLVLEHTPASMRTFDVSP